MKIGTFKPNFPLFLKHALHFKRDGFPDGDIVDSSHNTCISGSSDIVLSIN